MPVIMERYPLLVHKKRILENANNTVVNMINMAKHTFVKFGFLSFCVITKDTALASKKLTNTEIILTMWPSTNELHRWEWME